MPRICGLIEPAMHSIAPSSEQHTLLNLYSCTADTFIWRCRRWGVQFLCCHSIRIRRIFLLTYLLTYQLSSSVSLATFHWRSHGMEGRKGDRITEAHVTAVRFCFWNQIRSSSTIGGLRGDRPISDSTRKPSWRKVSARKECVYEGSLRRNVQQINDMRFPIDGCNRGRITYTVCEIFSYVEVKNRHFRPLYSDCRPQAEERSAPLSTMALPRLPGKERERERVGNRGKGGRGEKAGDFAGLTKSWIHHWAHPTKILLVPFSLALL